jgi:hypothetical protein
MSSSGIARRLALVRTDDSEERIIFNHSVTGIGEVGTTLAVISNRNMLPRPWSSTACIKLIKDFGSKFSVGLRRQPNTLRQKSKNKKSRAVSLAVSSQLPPPRSGLEPWSRREGFVADKTALGQVFTVYLGFYCQGLNRPLHIHYHSSLFGNSTIAQFVVSVREDSVPLNPKVEKNQEKREIK